MSGRLQEAPLTLPRKLPESAERTQSLPKEFPESLQQFSEPSQTVLPAAPMGGRDCLQSGWRSHKRYKSHFELSVFRGPLVLRTLIASNQCHPFMTLESSEVVSC